MGVSRATCKSDGRSPDGEHVAFSPSHPVSGLGISDLELVGDVQFTVLRIQRAGELSRPVDRPTGSIRPSLHRLASQGLYKPLILHVTMSDIAASTDQRAVSCVMPSQDPQRVSGILILMCCHVRAHHPERQAKPVKLRGPDLPWTRIDR